MRLVGFLGCADFGGSCQLSANGSLPGPGRSGVGAHARASLSGIDSDQPFRLRAVLKTAPLFFALGPIA
jgi:hypothetical protein